MTSPASAGAGQALLTPTTPAAAPLRGTAPTKEAPRSESRTRALVAGTAAACPGARRLQQLASRRHADAPGRRRGRLQRRRRRPSSTRPTNKGGTLKLANSRGLRLAATRPEPYYAWVWNFSRYYNRTLVTCELRRRVSAATKLVHDLARRSQDISADGLTYTYKLKPGLKFEDGSPISLGGHQVRHRARVRDRRHHRWPDLPDPVTRPRARTTPARTRTRTRRV